MVRQDEDTAPSEYLKKIRDKGRLREVEAKCKLDNTKVLSIDRK